MPFLKSNLATLVKHLANRYASNPNGKRIHEALDHLRNEILKGNTKKGVVKHFSTQTDRFIIFSDQHKGAKNGADDFAGAEACYLAALDHYNNNNYHFISLGDCEELWENSLAAVIEHNQPSFIKERLFVEKGAFTKVFGNHDLYWDNALTAKADLKGIYGTEVPIFEGAILQTTINGHSVQIFLTHGHQGDLVSDGNALSKWFVSNVWAKIQAYLKINPNTPAYDDQLKSEHNRLMYEWSAEQSNLLLITGHTHQPVFESLTHLERIYRTLENARLLKDAATIVKLEAEISKRIRRNGMAPDFTKYQPVYFNTGCCCFEDGDITGLEIAAGRIKLIKWHCGAETPVRVVLEDNTLENCMAISMFK